MYLSGLYAYPIKSMGGIPLEAWDVDGRGLRYDRRWMLVDEDGWFISQRELPRMALILVRIEPDRLVVNAPHMPALELPLGPTTGKTVSARIWDDLDRLGVPGIQGTSRCVPWTRIMGRQGIRSDSPTASHSCSSPKPPSPT